MNLPESWSPPGVPLPTFRHQIVDLRRTAAGRHQLDLFAVVGALMAAVVDNRLVGDAGERLSRRSGQHLPEGDAEGPNVALRRELALR